MEIIMLQDQTGSPDGVSVHNYEKGREYDMPDDLARVFLENNWARLAGQGKSADKKDQGRAPENKNRKK